MSTTNEAPKPNGSEQHAIAVQPKAGDVHLFEMQQRQARLFAMSGLFADIKGQTQEQAIAQAFVKIALGDAMGFSPAESMTGIDIIQGRVAVGANLRAARMQRAGFSWAPPPGKKGPSAKITDKGCWLPLYYKGEPILDSDGKQVVISYTEEDAKAAGLLAKDNYKKNPRNMYFARAITNAQRWYAPGVLGIDVLSTEEAIDVTYTEVPEAATATAVKASELRARLSEAKAAKEEPVEPEQTEVFEPEDDDQAGLL